MRLHRGALFWGLFLLLLGTIPLLDRQGVIDVQQYTELGRLWPIGIVAVGVAVLLSQTRFAAPGTALAAVILGALAGGAIAAGGGFVFNVGDCGGGSTSGMQQMTRQGTLDPDATVVLDFSCGTVDVATGPGAAWRLEADYRGNEPTVTASASRLELTSPGDGVRRHEWSLVLPRENVGALEASVNAASGIIDLGGASLPRLQLHANAGDVRVIAGGATIGRRRAPDHGARAAHVRHQPGRAVAHQEWQPLAARRIRAGHPAGCLRQCRRLQSRSLGRL